MLKLNDKILKETYGGGLSAGAYAAIAAGVSFIIGIVDGITRPLRCR